MKQIDAATLVGLACRLGTMRAIEFAEFARSLHELADDEQKLLLRGWLAIEEMPNDAALEAADLQKCLVALRQAWFKLKHGS